MAWHDSYSPYAKYTGQSVGRVLHFLYHYIGSHTAERATLGSSTEEGVSLVKFGDLPIATYTWTDCDIPVFDFYPPGWNTANRYNPFDERYRDDWTKAQELKRDKVKYPDEYLTATTNEWARFMDGIEKFVTYTAPPEGPRRDTWCRLMASLPYGQMRTFVACCKLYEAYKDKTNK